MEPSGTFGLATMSHVHIAFSIYFSASISHNASRLPLENLQQEKETKLRAYLHLEVGMVQVRVLAINLGIYVD